MTNTVQSRDLTRGSLWKQVLLVGIPLILSNILQITFNMADVAIVGRFSGTLALGSVGSTSILISTITGILIGLAGGITVMTARYIGARDITMVRKTVHTALLVSLLIGTSLLFFGVFCAEWILRLLNTKEELLEGAILYCKIYFLGMPAMGLYNFGHAVFSAAGDTKRPLRYLTLSGVVNIVLNLFFVVVCRMSVDGVALASILSQYLSAFLVVRALFQEHADYSLRFSEIRFSPRCAKDILAIGIPSALQNCIFGLSNLFIQTAVNTFDAIVVSGISAATHADAFISNVWYGFCVACSSFIGQNFGARNKKRVLQSYWVSQIYALASGTLLGILLTIFGRSFLSIFTRDAAAIEAGMYRITILGLSYALATFLDCTMCASRALGKTMIPAVIVIFGSCIFRVIWVLTIFAHFRTLASLYLLYTASWLITATAEFLYFMHIYRKIDFSEDNSAHSPCQ